MKSRHKTRCSYCGRFIKRTSWWKIAFLNLTLRNLWCPRCIKDSEQLAKELGQYRINLLKNEKTNSR